LWLTALELSVTHYLRPNYLQYSPPSVIESIETFSVPLANFPYINTNNTLLLKSRSFVPLLYWFDDQIAVILLKADLIVPL